MGKHNEEKSRKPREMVHRAQAQCSTCVLQLQRAHQGRPDAPDFETAREEFHAAVFLYWEQIKRFASEARIEELWHEEAVGDLEYTLADLGRKRLETETVRREQTDPDTQSLQQLTEEQPWTLPPEEALQVYDKLDACANALGFDAKPDEDRPHRNYADGLQTEAGEGVEVPDEL
jgi:hypothetical protein